MTLPASAATLLVACLLIPGCGDGESGGEQPSENEARQQVIDVVDSFWNAAVAEDGQRGCAYLTDFGKQLVAKVIDNPEGEEGPEVDEYDPADCQVALSSSGRLFRAVDYRVEPRQVQIDGDTATVSDRRASGNILRLERIGGDWKLVYPIFTGR